MKTAELGKQVRIYLWIVNALGLSLAAVSLATGGLRITPEFLILAAITAIMSPHSVRIGTRMEMSVFHPFILTSMLVMGLNASLVIAALAILSLSLFHKPRWELYRILFNSSTFMITTWLTCQVFRLTGGTTAPLVLEQGLPALMLATLVFYLSNTLLVAGVVGISSHLPISRVWHEKYLWSAPSYFAGGALALVMKALVDRFGIYSLVLCLPFSILLYYSYRLYVDKWEEEKRHLEDIEKMNLELEKKVRERTRELEVLNQKLQVSNRELVRVNKLKSEFLANMSHELRTPLNAIIGFSELLLDDSEGTLRQNEREYVADIRTSGRHLLELINDILDLSKIEAGKMKMAIDSLELSPVVEEALATLRFEAGRKKITLEARLEADLPPLEADRGKLKQILTNLLSNAVKFTPSGGRVSLSAHWVDDELEISVEDNGIGIPHEAQERIFEAFVQVDGSYARQHPGTGLGLTLVKRFVEMHGGTITLRSEPEQGSKFTLRLPQGGSRPGDGNVVQKRSQPSPLDSPAAPGGPGHLILVVEDNPVNLKLVRNVLRARGYRVLEASSGEEALAAVQVNRPDLILMDIQLPGMDGLTATRRLKNDPSTRDIPTIALTAHAMKNDETRFLEAGCAGYISKPIDTMTFPHQVAEYLSAGVH